MTTVLREAGFVVYIYGNDHLPKHVHVHEGSFSGALLKVNLNDLSVMVNYMKPAVARRALHLVKANREKLIQEWNRIHGA